MPYQLPLKAAAGTPEAPAPQGKIVPDVVGMSLADAKQQISKAGFVPVVDGEGDRVWGQTPPGETRVNSGTRILLYPGPNEARNEETQEVTVPDVTGKTIREAGSIIGAAGLRLKAEGSGVAVKQSISPGTVVKAGTTLNVEFKSAASP